MQPYTDVHGRAGAYADPGTTPTQVATLSATYVGSSQRRQIPIQVIMPGPAIPGVFLSFLQTLRTQSRRARHLPTHTPEGAGITS